MDKILGEVGKKRPAVLPFVVRQLRVWFRNPVYDEVEREMGEVGQVRFLQFNEDPFLSGPLPELLFTAAKYLNLTLEHVDGLQHEFYLESNFSRDETTARCFREDVSNFIVFVTNTNV